MRKLFSCINWKVEVLERVQIQNTKEGSGKKAFICWNIQNFAIQRKPMEMQGSTTQSTDKNLIWQEHRGRQDCLHTLDEGGNKPQLNIFKTINRQEVKPNRTRNTEIMKHYWKCELKLSTISMKTHLHYHKLTSKCYNNKIQQKIQRIQTCKTLGQCHFHWV